MIFIHLTVANVFCAIGILSTYSMAASAASAIYSKCSSFSNTVSKKYDSSRDGVKNFFGMTAEEQGQNSVSEDAFKTVEEKKSIAQGA